MKFLAVIQARAGSTRLPGKILKDLFGKTVLERVIERTAQSEAVSEVAVVTSVGKENLPVIRICAERGVRVSCGSEDDVLDRYYQFAKLIRPEHVVRITADCPLIDPAVITRVLHAHLETGADYTSNSITPSYPDGEDVEVFSFATLEKAWRSAGLASEREHVTPYIKKHGELFRLHNVYYSPDLSMKRWTLDHMNDYDFIRAVYDAMPDKNRFGMPEILKLLSARPELEHMNTGHHRYEGYNKSLKEDKAVQAGERP